MKKSTNSLQVSQLYMSLCHTNRPDDANSEKKLNKLAIAVGSSKIAMITLQPGKEGAAYQNYSLKGIMSSVHQVHTANCE